MTRAKEIMKEAEKAASANTQIIGDWGEHYLGFIHGAEWADSHPHWISVEDELPPIFPLNPNESMNVITYGLHTMVNWYDYERGEWVRDSEITHWMPLTQPPESGNNSKEGGEA